MGAVTAAPNLAGFPWPERIVKAGVKNGITWAVSEAYLPGSVNGYVHLPKPHPWRSADNESGIRAAKGQGGITYFKGDWCGFDTAHWFQHWPQCPLPPFPGAEMMTVEKVIGYAKDLAQEAATAVDTGHYNI